MKKVPIEYVYTTGAHITPVLQADGIYRWVVTNFEDDTYMNGDYISVNEESLSLDGCVDWHEEEEEE